MRALREHPRGWFPHDDRDAFLVASVRETVPLFGGKDAVDTPYGQRVRGRYAASVCRVQPALLGRAIVSGQRRQLLARGAGDRAGPKLPRRCGTSATGMPAASICRCGESGEPGSPQYTDGVPAWLHHDLDAAAVQRRGRQARRGQDADADAVITAGPRQNVSERVQSYLFLRPARFIQYLPAALERGLFGVDRAGVRNFARASRFSRCRRGVSPSWRCGAFFGRYIGGVHATWRCRSPPAAKPWPRINAILSRAPERRGKIVALRDAGDEQVRVAELVVDIPTGHVRARYAGLMPHRLQRHRTDRVRYDIFLMRMHDAMTSGRALKIEPWMKRSR